MITGRFFAAGATAASLVMIALLVAAAIVVPVLSTWRCPPTARCMCRPTWWR